MAKRDTETRRSAAATTGKPTGSAAASAMEQRLLALAEQLGRVAGTIEVKTEGWANLDTVENQIAGLRKGATQLLEQLRGGAKGSKKKSAAKGSAGAAKSTRGRSGGAVDAPGKKHRKPAPSVKAAKTSTATAKARAAKTMVRTPRRGGRG
jgi:hypothetical protein